VQVTNYTLTYSDWTSALRYTNAFMRNKAGNDVAISVNSIQSAMKDFQAQLQDGTGELTSSNANIEAKSLGANTPHRLRSQMTC
jgi:hypothetical protein